MTNKDQELIAEAYLNEIFGLGSKPQMIDLKKELDPESYNVVANVFRMNSNLRNYSQSCNKISCMIDKNNIPKICGILKKEYDSTDDSSERLDAIIDAHDALIQLHQPTSGYQSSADPQPWGYKPAND